MIPELINESLHFCTRDELESMQMVCRVFRQLIVSGSNTLPRRTLGHADLVSQKAFGGVINGKKT